jgi:Zn-dependent M28 family amino/carboxypeptidase
MFRFAIFALLVSTALAQPTPATKRWWAHVQTLADDKLQGRDTGSEGYRTAARYVTEQFERAGLKPAGEKGYYQAVPLTVLQVQPESTVELVREGTSTPLRINEQVGVTPKSGLAPVIEAPLVFGGSATPGNIVVTIAGMVVQANGAVGVLTIDNPQGLEAPRWPIAYAKSMSVEGGQPRAAAAPGIALRLNPASAELLFAGSGHTFAEMVDLFASGKPVPSFPLKATLRVTIKVESSTLTSDNIIALLPGSELPDEYVVVSAHLDGYGLGTPVNGDRIYNGAFDDAACVANLIELAADLKRSGHKPRRSLLFAVFTGEEKGLLGSRWFTTHLTVPKEKIVADINLDYIRPIFPLTILTTLGLEESTLGEVARKVAVPLGIRIQPDDESQRGLYRRSDQYNFIRNGIPGIAFIFGYENGSKEEAIYRAWYKDRYHRPSDDLQQPVNWAGAEKFHQFFSAMALAVADAPEKQRFR